MALIDLPGRHIHAKIVYYGPELGGKTTNVRRVAELVPAAEPDRLREIAAGERTVFSDTLPLDLGRLAGFRVTIDLLTVAGQPRYRNARQAVLNGADGVVFVADAQADRLPENERSLAELREFATVQGRAYPEFPLVLQYNKSDLPGALPSADLDAALNPDCLPTVRAVALDGTGVVETLRTVMRRVAAGL